MHPLLPLLLVFQIAPWVYADDFTCKFKAGGRDYDLTSLGEQTVSREHFDTPSHFKDTLTFNLCDSIKKTEAAESDQCPQGTRACLIESNKKGDDPDRITRVIPLATTEKMAVEISQLSDPLKGVNLIMHGPMYPPPEDTPKDIRIEQSFNVSIICPSNGATEGMTLKEYRNGQAYVEVLNKVVCDETQPPADNDGSSGGSPSSGGSGVGYFFLAVFLAFGAYFALGAYYNYTKYGASGWDLIPHRDFWRDVPYLLRDVFNHLCSSVRPRGGNLSGRGGYVQV